MINVQVEKGAQENSLSILRRFTKRVQGAGILSRVRSIRYYDRNMSAGTRKKKALKRLRYNEAQALGIKLGKIKPVEGRQRR